MNKVLMSLVLGSFVLVGSAYAQTPTPVAAPAAPDASAPAAVKPVRHEAHHPELHKALRKLRGAKADLEKATHDYGGHRVAAIGYINQAIAEIQAALETTHQ